MVRKRKDDGSNINSHLTDHLIKERGVRTALDCESLAGELRNALTKQTLNAEMDVHLGIEDEQEGGNHRSGTSPKTMVSGAEGVVLDIPLDRQGLFDPVLSGKYQPRVPSFDINTVQLATSGYGSSIPVATNETMDGRAKNRRVELKRM